MKNIFTILFLLIPILSYGQGKVRFGATRESDTSYTYWLQVINGVRFNYLASDDSNKVIGVNSKGELVLRTKAAGGNTYTSGFGIDIISDAITVDSNDIAGSFIRKNITTTPQTAAYRINGAATSYKGNFGDAITLPETGLNPVNRVVFISQDSLNPYSPISTMNKTGLVSDIRLGYTTTPSYGTVQGFGISSNVSIRADNNQNLPAGNSHPTFRAFSGAVNSLNGSSGFIRRGAVYYGTISSGATATRFGEIDLVDVTGSTGTKTDYLVGFNISDADNIGTRGNTGLYLRNADGDSVARGSFGIVGNYGNKWFNRGGLYLASRSKLSTWLRSATGNGDSLVSAIMDASTIGLYVEDEIVGEKISRYTSNLRDQFTDFTHIDKRYADSIYTKVLQISGNTYQPLGTYLTWPDTISTLATQSDLAAVSGTGKVAYTDTAAMLSPYLRAILGVKYTDTATMLLPYLRKVDTTAMLANYARLVNVVKYGDTAGMLNNYARSVNVLKYVDSAAMLAAYQRKIDSLLSWRVNGNAGAGMRLGTTTNDSWSFGANGSFPWVVGNSPQSITCTADITTPFSTTTATTGVASTTWQIINTRNTGATGSAGMRITVGGTTSGASGGDATTRYDIGTTQTWTTGIDNSDADAYIIAASAALGGSNAFRLTTSGVATVTGNFTANNMADNSTDGIQTTSSIIGSGFAQAIRSVSISTATLANSDGTLLCNTASNSITVTLPTVGVSTGRIFYIMKTDAANTVTLDPNGATLINGASTFPFTTLNQSVQVQWSGSAYYVTSSN